MHPSLTFVAGRCLRMMCSLLMLTGIVLFGRFAVMLGCVGAMFCSLPMMVGSCLGHGVSFSIFVNSRYGRVLDIQRRRRPARDRCLDLPHRWNLTGRGAPESLSPTE